MAVLKDLIVHGQSRFINGARFNTINAESIGASEGIFNKLVATTLDAREATIDNLTTTNAKVVGMLDVEGELHTNAWTNANIANIGGSFYISPTIEAVIGTISITRTVDNDVVSWTVAATGNFATDFIKSGTNTEGVTWTANSLVLITGNITLGNLEYPLGTLKGTLRSPVTASAASTPKTVTITNVVDAQNNTTVLQELYELNHNTNISGAIFSKGKISLYKLGSYPIGIQLSSMGVNSNSIIEIYGGVKANPTVRIGHLAGLPAINGDPPTGWGIYTDNGYFSGVIVSNSGKIGNFTIASDLHSGDGIGIGNSVYVSTGTSSSQSIGNSTGTLNWAFTAGNKFGVTTNGDLYANSAKIDGSISTSSLTIKSNATVTDTDGIITNSAIHIGGRNLLTNIPTVWKLATIDGQGNYGTSTTTTYFAPTDTEDGDTWAIDVSNNTEYTITAYNDYNSDIISVDIYELTMNGDNYSYIRHSGWKNCTTSSYTFTTSSTTILLRLIFSSSTNNRTISEALISQIGTDVRIQLEKGNKATDWTPDYEDVAEQTNIVYDMAKQSVVDIDDLYVDTLGDRVYYLYQGDYSFQITKDEARDSLKTYYIQTSTSYREASSDADFAYFDIEYELTGDTEIVNGKIYYELIDGEYIEIINPIIDNISTYYELVEHDPLFELIITFTNVYYDENEGRYYYTDNTGQIAYMQNDSLLEKTFEYNLTTGTNINIYTVYTERKFEIVSGEEHITTVYYYITIVNGQSQKHIISDTNFNSEYVYTIDGVEKTLYYTYGDNRHWYYLEEDQPQYPTISSGTQPTKTNTIYTVITGREGGLQGDISLLQV